LLKQTGLVCDHISLDAGHAYPDTLEPIHQAGGTSVVQIKLNQPQLFKMLAEQAEQGGLLKTGVVITTVDKGHGRLEERVGRVLTLNNKSMERRREPTGMQMVIVMDRNTYDLTTCHTSAERSYYVSNQSAQGHERE